jgi:RNA polymerase sigma-70 factor, ECF subfamily
VKISHSRWEEGAVPDETVARFEQVVVPHMDAAYNLARWLTRNDHDAEDLVQEAYLRAFKFFGSFHGTNARSWLLTIVRNTCYTWFRENRTQELTTSFEEDIHSTEADPFDPEKLLMQSESSQLLKQALEDLPLEFREVLILRELEGLSYKDIAVIAGIPPGTVMSRLARARSRLKQCLTKLMNKER